MFAVHKVEEIKWNILWKPKFSQNTIIFYETRKSVKRKLKAVKLQLYTRLVRERV